MPAASSPPITVRMYKGLLGDCFLLRVGSGEAASSILIDCGVLQGIQGAAKRMADVAADIVTATGGRLDLLIVTHEHFDHLSGFGYASDTFFGGKLKIGAAWMGWTEDPHDVQAQGLRARFDKGKAAVAAAAQEAGRMADRGVAGAALVTAGLEKFIGPVVSGLGVAGGPRTTRDILEAIKKTAGSVTYLAPGQVLPTPGATPLRAYVLGPPRSEARLFKALPSAGDAKETYMGGDGLSLADHLLAVLGPSSAADASGPDRPFPTPYNHPLDLSGDGPPPPPPPPSAGPHSSTDAAADWLSHIYAQGPAWRRIDTEWLEGAGALALKLDSNTNNTSLALAFETPSGDVLLFAADAQVGNWLSWRDQDYPDPDDKTAPPRTMDDLLPRVVVYKVGHHASHNATLDAQGLERMTHPGLAAFIPVVEDDAHAQGGGWNMPFPPLLTRLLEMTQGRVMRGDALAGCDRSGKALTTDAAFLAAAKDSPDGLYVDYALAGS